MVQSESTVVSVHYTQVIGQDVLVFFRSSLDCPIRIRFSTVSILSPDAPRTRCHFICSAADQLLWWGCPPKPPTWKTPSQPSIPLILQRRISLNVSVDDVGSSRCRPESHALHQEDGGAIILIAHRPSKHRFSNSSRFHGSPEHAHETPTPWSTEHTKYHEVLPRCTCSISIPKDCFFGH